MNGQWIIDTDVDARTTLGRMARLCRKAMSEPAVIHAANVIVSATAPRDVTEQILAISEFVESYFRFVPNPLGTQTIRPPGWTNKPDAPGMLEDIAARGVTQGACDDAAVLIATLAMANGIPARFRALAFDPNEAFTHVLTDLHDGTNWLELDTTRPEHLPPPTDADIARTMTLEVA